MKSSVLVVSLWLGVFASGASAADVSIYGNVSQTLEASDNYFLANAPSGYTLKPLSAVTLDALVATPTTRYLLDTNYSYYKYSGPGAADTNLTWGTPASATFSINNADKLTKYNLAASWKRDDVATTLLTQTGTAAGRGTFDTYAIDGGVTRNLSRLDSISWSAHASTVSYSDPTQTPYVDFSTTAAWNHNINATTTLTNSANFDWFSQDNEVKSQRLFWQFMTGLQSQLTPRLSFNGQVGAAFVNAYQKGEIQLIMPPGVFQQKVGTAQGWTGNIGLNYKLLKDTRVSLNAARSIVPTIYGQLQRIESIGLTLNHDINFFASLTFFTQFSHLETAETANTGPTASDNFTASADFGYKLAREWRANLSYTYRQKNDATGLAKSSTVLIKLARDFTLYGKRAAAVEKTPSELAQESLARAQLAFPNSIP